MQQITLDTFDRTLLEYVKLNTMIRVNDVRKFFYTSAGIVYPRLNRLRRFGYVKIEKVRHLRGKVVKLTTHGIQMIKPKLA